MIKKVLFHKIMNYFMSKVKLLHYGVSSFKPQTDDMREAPSLYSKEFIRSWCYRQSIRPIAIKEAKHHFGDYFIL
jgi:UDP-N-acetyl-D-mannosaminuronate dehydrogenase